LGAGCSADDPLNPTFPLKLLDARKALDRMAEAPAPLERPVVVVGGIYDPGLVASGIARHIRRAAGSGAPVMTISFFGVGSFEKCRGRLVEAVQERFPCDDPDVTVAVDVVAFSMGGLVARDAARPGGERRLNIRRLFTIATPHRGARIAGIPWLDRRVVDMRPGSAFLAELDAALADAGYELHAYARLGDTVVGTENTAPPGMVPIWVANDPFSFAHIGSGSDDRILADIITRLRGELPFATEPPAEPPNGRNRRPEP
jgi:hypothetical protein